MSTPVDRLPAPPARPELEAGHAVVYNHRARPLEMLRESWDQRALIPRIGIRVTIKGYSGTKLGRAWLILRPTANIFAMSLLFGGVLGAPSSGVPYPVFLLVGMLAWLAFERTAFWATKSFDVYRRISNGVYFPLLLVPLASGMAAAVEFSVVSLLLLVTSACYLVADGSFYPRVGPSLLLVPVGVGLAVGFAWALGLWTSALNARARDVRIVFRYILMIWMYVTPVLYAPTALPAGLQFLATVNPVAAPVEMVKEGLLGAGSIKPAGIAITVACFLAIGIPGLAFFCRMAPGLLLGQPPGVDDDDIA